MGEFKNGSRTVDITGNNFYMSGIDTKIEPLVKFLNQLDGVFTIGSCQGHDDGGGSGEWVYPYIKFKCINNRTLGFLASLEDAYKSINEQAELKYFNSSLAFEPDLNGDWCIEVVKNIDFNEFVRFLQKLSFKMVR